MSETAPPSSPSLAGLRRELAAAGLGGPAGARSAVKFLALLGAALLFFAPIAFLDVSWWLVAPLAVVSSWFLTAAAMCGHDGAHGTASSRSWLNTLLAEVAFALLSGLSVSYWRHKHNVLHHPNVNMAEKDPDVEQSPLALSDRQYNEHGSPIRFLQRHVQMLGFWLLGGPLVGAALRWASLKHLAGQLAAGEHVRENLVDLAFLAGHYVAWIVLPLAFFGWWPTLLVYGISTLLTGFYLTLIFAPAHMPYPLVRSSTDPLLLQLASTRDFRTNAFFEMTLIGLNRQIEHHVAQKLHHFDLARAAPIVRAYCLRHGLPYHETSWLRALRDTSHQIRHGWGQAEIVLGAEPGGAEA